MYRDQSPGKLSSLEQCKQSCEDEVACLSITYFVSGWCSHFSTPCNASKWKSKATALRLNRVPDSTTDSGLSTFSDPTTTTTAKSITVAGPTPSPRPAQLGQHWMQVGEKAACDTSAGEIYNQQSPGKISSFEKCKRLCENDASCNSITFFRTGWCSHFSTPCTYVSDINNAMGAWRLIRLSS